MANHTTPGGSNLVFFSLLKSRLSFQMSRVIRSWLLVSPLLLSNLNHLEYWDKPRKLMKVCGHYIFPKTGLAVGSLLRKNVCAQACLYLSAWVAFCSMFHAGLCDAFSFVLVLQQFLQIVQNNRVLPVPSCFLLTCLGFRPIPTRSSTNGYKAGAMPNQSVPVFLTEPIAVCPGLKISGTWHDMAEDSMAWNRIGWQLSLMQLSSRLCQWEKHRRKTVSTLQMQRQEHTGAPKRETCATAQGKSLTALSFLMATCTPCQKQSKLTKILGGFDKTDASQVSSMLQHVKPFFHIFGQHHVNLIEITWNVGRVWQKAPSVGIHDCLFRRTWVIWVILEVLFSKVMSNGMWKCGTDQSGVQYKVGKIVASTFSLPWLNLQPVSP